MRFNTKEPRSDREWHRWFAWRPVRLDDTRTWVWLETIERREIFIRCPPDGMFEWHYRDCFGLMVIARETP